MRKQLIALMVLLICMIECNNIGFESQIQFGENSHPRASATDGDPDDYYISEMRCYQAKGSTFIDYQVQIVFDCGTTTYLKHGQYMFQLQALGDFETCYNMSTGTDLAGSTSWDPWVSADAVVPIVNSYQTITATFVFQESSYIPTHTGYWSYKYGASGDSDWYTGTINFRRVNATSASIGQVTGVALTTPTYFNVYYDFHPIITFDDTYWNVLNTYPEIYDYITAQWVKQDWGDLSLTHYAYKLRIRSNYDGTILFEDGTAQAVKTIRSVSLTTYPTQPSYAEIPIGTMVRISQERGDAKLKWEIPVRLVSASQNLFAGTYSVILSSLGSWTSLNDIRTTGTSTSTTFYTGTAAIVTSDASATYSSTGTYICYSSNYMINQSVYNSGSLFVPRISDASYDLTASWSNFYEGGSAAKTGITSMSGSTTNYIVYLFRPEVTLVSDYYNFENTILEVKDMNRPASWIQQPWDAVELQHYSYMFRIKDLNGGILYQDTTYKQVYAKISIVLPGIYCPFSNYGVEALTFSNDPLSTTMKWSFGNEFYLNTSLDKDFYNNSWQYASTFSFFNPDFVNNVVDGSIEGPMTLLNWYQQISGIGCLDSLVSGFSRYMYTTNMLTTDYYMIPMGSYSSEEGGFSFEYENGFVTINISDSLFWLSDILDDARSIDYAMSLVDNNGLGWSLQYYHAPYAYMSNFNELSINHYNYDLQMILNLNASYYSIDDLLVYVYTPSKASDLLDGLLEFDWIEQNGIIHLNCPQYKIRLVDKISRNIVFEDPDFQNFTTTRSLDMADFKFKSNAAEPIDVTFTNEITAESFLVRIEPYMVFMSNYSDSDLYHYEICDIYGNNLGENWFDNSNSSITYNPAYNAPCMISLANQRGEYLNWENYIIKVNGTQIYSNTFSKEIGTDWNVSIYTRFNRYITSSIYTINRESNYIPFTITQFSLKVYNQQESFIYSNITFDPNYYVSNQYWSEWIAPGEIVEYFLSTDHYRVNITEYETDTTTIYSYFLDGDDLLLVTSVNTLLNVIANIQNVNSTIGNQITNVEINLTNQNSAINNSIINIDINLNNVNSSLGNLLLSQNVTLTNIANDIDNVYIYQQNQFTSLNNLVNTSFIDLNTSVYMVNNSIYTSVNALSTQLSLVNNSISGNMSLLLQLSPQLTAIYTNTLFSEFLNWSQNPDAVMAQTELVNFINQYRNESVLLQLKYQNEIRNLTIAAQESINQAMIDHDVDYQVLSLSDNAILQEWQPLLNNTIELGFYEDNLEPKDLQAELNDWILVIIIFGFICAAMISVIMIQRKKNQKAKIVRSFANEKSLELFR